MARSCLQQAWEWISTSWNNTQGSLPKIPGDTAGFAHPTFIPTNLRRATVLRTEHDEYEPLLTASPPSSARASQEYTSNSTIHSPSAISLRDSSRGLQLAPGAVRWSRSSDKASPSPQRTRSGSELQSALFDARHEWPPNQNSYFVPVDALENLLNIDAILDELARYQLQCPATEVRNLAQLISEKARKLFAILIYLGLGETIEQFIDENLSDDHLPFERSNETRSPKRWNLRSKLRLDQPIKCMADWKQPDINDFDRVQWYVLAPVFDNSGNVQVPHYDLDKNQVLPFLKDEEQGNDVQEGGFSSVWEISIHPAHQKLLSDYKDKGQIPSIALKRLHSTKEEDFLSEVAMLKAFAGHGHPHLIKLLATYRHKNRYYLLFPFAKSNLRKYWEDMPAPAFTVCTMMWTVHQCKAIASGLYLIHEREATHKYADWPRILKAKNKESGIEDDDPIYGRHGDIKPENILWSDDLEETHEEHCGCFPKQGFLIIADFGLMDLHKRMTRSKILATNIGGSQTYEPPEIRLEKRISRAYDIWSLGCLYLEFITWLVQGWEGLSRFAKARAATDAQGLNDDTFYKIIEAKEGSGKTATLRRNVRAWINDLHKDPLSSLFIHDFLDLVQNEMLVVERSRRIMSGPLNVRLRAMLDKGKTDPSYLTKAHPRPPKKTDQRQEVPFERHTSDPLGRPVAPSPLRRHNTTAL